jgi:hypothetical protein
MSIAYIIAITVAAIGAWIAFVRLPTWYFRSHFRHRLWEERDLIADQMLSGELPRDHAAVRELLQVAEHEARATHSLTILDLYFWHGVHRRCDLSKLDVLDTPLAGLAEKQRKAVLAHRDRISTLALQSMLVGSWLGIGAISMRLLPAAVRVLRKARADRRRAAPSLVRTAPRATFITATNDVSESRIGKAAREFIHIEDGVLKGRGHVPTGDLVGA